MSHSAGRASQKLKWSETDSMRIIWELTCSPRLGKTFVPRTPRLANLPRVSSNILPSMGRTVFHVPTRGAWLPFGTERCFSETLWDPGFLLMQGNARYHVAGVCQYVMLQEKDIKAMDWPTSSPVVNPLKQKWDMMSGSKNHRLFRNWQMLQSKTGRRSLRRLLLTHQEDDAFYREVINCTVPHVDLSSGHYIKVGWIRYFHFNFESIQASTV